MSIDKHVASLRTTGIEGEVPGPPSNSGQWAVEELARDLPVSRPAVSQHLRVLRDAGLVTDSRDGSRRVYRVDPHGVAGMRQAVGGDGGWSHLLALYRDAA